MSEKCERCTRCVLSSGFPRIQFDADGVCSFCRDRLFYATGDGVIEEAKTHVEGLLANLPKEGRHDALVCLSGGKDSTYTLMLAVRKYRLRVLAFTFDNGFLSSYAFENVRRAVDALGVDHITVRPSYEAMKSIVRASATRQIWSPRTLVRISAVCNSCITMVNNAAVTLALEQRIPLVIAGFTLGQIPSNAVVYKPNSLLMNESRQKAVAALEEHSGREVVRYFTMREDLIRLPAPWNVNLLCLESASEGDIIKSVSDIGWRQPDDVDGCSSNCRLNAFNNFAHEMAYSYNPYELELSHLVRKGLLSREEALSKLHEKAEPQVDAVLEELCMSRAELLAATAALGGAIRAQTKRPGDE
jgi:hypothetical protein